MKDKVIVMNKEEHNAITMPVILGDSKLLVEYIERSNKQAKIDILEEMKEKIQELAYYDSDYGFALPEYEVSDIIYDYIRELKGE